VSSYTFEELVTLEERETDLFVPTVYPAAEVPFVFGGQLAAQSVRAAMASVPGARMPHSLHAHFLAAASPNGALQFRVHRVRDGRSFSLRQVDVDQDGRRVFTATVSFHAAPADTPAPDYQIGGPVAPDPEGRGPWADYMRNSEYFSILDLRELPAAPPDPDGRREHSRRLWFRVPEALSDDPSLHVTALAFASDLGVTVAASVTAGLYRRATVLTSLDHVLWWHRPVRADSWTLLDLESVSNSHQRGTVRGTMHSADGTLAASLGQDTLIR
jgi:acyl-CoA thioesterase-2